MINLASRDILHSWGKFVFTGAGLGLLIGVTLTMAGVYRGMVDDARAMIDNAGADLWVVQQDTLGPYAEPSSIHDDVARDLLGQAGVLAVGNVAYLTMQIQQQGGKDVRVMLVGIEQGLPGEPAYLVAGRPITHTHYEALADIKTGLTLGERIQIRRHAYTVVGITQRMVSSSGDPMVFVPLKDAQEVQFLKDNDALLNERARTALNPAFNRVPGLLDTVLAGQASSHMVNAVLVRIKAGHDVQEVASQIRRWKHLQAYSREQMEEILVAKLIATSAKQIFMFLVILSIVSAAIVAFIIYTMTMNKIREIAVLKLVGAGNQTISGMILQQALGLGLIGFVVGKTAATLWAPLFPKYVLLIPGDAIRGFILVMLMCSLASIFAIRAALKIDPATAIGG
ncbi:MAG: ABC transporter permease [Gallionella sp.]|nr:ABC transporter permease [Gallionella sp.]